MDTERLNDQISKIEKLWIKLKYDVRDKDQIYSLPQQKFKNHLFNESIYASLITTLKKKNQNLKR